MQSRLILTKMVAGVLCLWMLASLLPGSVPANAAPHVIEWPQLVLLPYKSGFTNPVHITHAGDSSQRLFVVEQNGYIRIIQSGNTHIIPFLNIDDRVLSGGEQGLLSVAFPPAYASKGYFYVYYTRNDGNNQVSRFHLKPGNPDEGDPASEDPILTLNHPGATNHNGGQLAFGPDGYLYIATGDGAVGSNAQNPASLLGKVLRIDVESGVEPYAIPPSNPYTQTTGYADEIWALGLRNPWRFSFDRLTGDLYIGDVGQNRVEEIDFQSAASDGGENYGWNTLEGNLCYSPSSGCVPPPVYSPPVATYEHGPNEVTGCSVTGGAVYRGAAYPRMQGMYFYGDFCSGRIWGMMNDAGWHTLELKDSSLFISSFGEGEGGSIFVLDRAAGMVYTMSDTLLDLPFHTFLPMILK